MLRNTIQRWLVYIYPHKTYRKRFLSNRRLSSEMVMFPIAAVVSALGLSGPEEDEPATTDALTAALEAEPGAGFEGDRSAKG